jgi:hypothetical protein
MRHFLRLAQGVNVIPLLHALAKQPNLWNQNNLRTLYPNSPHVEADDIWLRFNNDKIAEKSPIEIAHDLETINYAAWYKLPQVPPMVFDLMRLVDATRLGRVMITRLAPGKKIYSHTDGGGYADYFKRYHVILQNLPGSNTRAENEVVCPKAGEVYWFNNNVEHEVVNHSNEDRITLIIDLRSV